MIDINRTVTGTEELTLEQVKSFIRVDGTTDDALITSLITQSRELIEEYLDRSMIESDVIATMSYRYSFTPPFAPIDTITSIIDVDGDAIEYEYDGLTVKLSTAKTFKVIYNTLKDNKEGLILAWLQTIAYLYENRGDLFEITYILNGNTNLKPYRNKMWF